MGKLRGMPRPASVERALSVLAVEVEQIQKGNYDHYMQVLIKVHAFVAMFVSILASLFLFPY
jgi:glucosamine 6-phosphate synthetase-like amidotransferase/phosphosugar isomerase protein